MDFEKARPYFLLIGVSGGLVVLNYQDQLYLTVESYCKVYDLDFNNVMSRFEKVKDIPYLNHIKSYEMKTNILYNICNYSLIGHICTIDTYPLLLCKDDRKLFLEISQQGFMQYFRNVANIGINHNAYYEHD